MVDLDLVKSRHMVSLSWNKANILSIADYFLRGHAVVMPTDTIYGVLALALNKESVEKIYKIKGRNPSKPFIILIGKTDDLNLFGIKTTSWQDEVMQKLWPGKVSIVVQCPVDELEYLHRGTYSLAFRLPDNDMLRDLVELTGPLIAPSANPEGLDPSLNIEMASSYFEDKVDVYVDGGEIDSSSSTLVSIKDGSIEVLRGQLPEPKK